MRERPKGRFGRMGGLIAALAILLSKAKSIGFLVIKLLKFGKLGPTIWSMALSIGAYALIYPWPFAVGLVAMLFIHEMGHVLAARRAGLPVTLPAFIPFLGAVILLKRQPADAPTEAFVAIGGPAFGTLGALGAFGLARWLDSPLIMLVAWAGFFINLLNLLPIHPLDGGRIVVAISRWLWIVGLVVGLVVIIYLQAIVFLLFWFLFALELARTVFGRKNDGDLEAVLTVPASPAVFEAVGAPVPGEAHRRALDFRQYVRLDDRESVLEVDYPGVGKIGEVSFPLGTVTEAEMLGYHRLGPATGRLRLRVRYRSERTPRGIAVDPEYYRVPLGTRLAYGGAYFGLIAFLLVMTGVAAGSLPPPPPR
ncbi:site-2 protease family protein [Hydrogenibacillus schlegelii]|uniref:Site-2 protease family protein n=2 Tax=Hydrogenibacillus schlegelii TaxID=1484 RepID=A0A947D2F5_HYDSH|nr:site-2 protease family protein [Hydrogenibacillus schlegelii]MBT9281613.1 site-2 protease family protein [Hydrogenibacillus schlegelii]